MACGEPGIGNPMSTRSRIIIGALVVAFIVAVCIAAFRPHPIYRIKWNEMTSTAVIEQYTHISNGYLDWDQMHQLGNFKNVEDANRALDKIMKDVNKRRAEEASWKVVREER